MSTDPQFTPKNHPLLASLAKRFWPELVDRSPERQMIGVGEIVSTLYAIPLAITGLIWLVRVTDLNWLQKHFGYFLLFAVLIVIFNQLGFFLIVELRKNRYGSADGALTGLPLWSGVLIFGPTIFWLPVLWAVSQFLINWPRATTKSTKWSQTRNFIMNLTSETLVPLVAFQAYLAVGGPFPLTELTIWSIITAMLLFAVHFLGYTIFWAPYLIYHTWTQQEITGNKEILPILKFFFLAIGLPQLANPFAILAAGLYAQNGLWVFLYFTSGMIVVAYLAHRLSWSAERGRQSSRLLEKLEILSRRIIDSPPETENLPQILQEHLTNMFPAGRLVVWVFPDEVLAQYPPEWEPDTEVLWPWLLDKSEGEVFLSRDPLPWMDHDVEHNPAVIAPILEVKSSQTFGGIYLELHTLAQPWNRKALQNLCPAVQALAAQIASAINQAKSYEQALELNRVNEQLQMAGNIQASLLPFSFPDMPGWQLAVTLDPAGETSGDFFDIIPLEGGRIGFLIADVLDKGLGPALYMILSRTLIRTYATEFDLQPDLVFFATNERILKDTRANLFVTVFFGVVDMMTGEMTYSNAGHNPPYIVSRQNGCEPVPLGKTGFPIGIDEDSTWTRETVQIHPGDILVLYTDGVPDAQNLDGKFFKEKSLVEVVKENLGQSAEEIQKNILDAVYDFVGDAPPFDDITLMVLVRDNETLGS
jgi:serine phosphatase RsbU (regulator of sigma subunit)